MNSNILSLFTNADKGTGGYHSAELRKKLIQDKFEVSNFISIKKNKINIYSGLSCIFLGNQFFSITSLRYLGLNSKILKSKKYNTIYLHTLHLIWLCKLSPRKNYILNLENFDPIYFSELAKLSNNLFQKIYYLIEVYFSIRIIKNLHKIDNLVIWPLTKKDSNQVIKLNSKLKELIQVQPHILLTKNFKNNRSKFISSKVRLLFIGHGNHMANREAINFIKQLAKINQSLIFDIIGRGWEKENVLNKNKNIKFHGFVEDITTKISNNTFFISPIFSGSGINMKIITAIELGIHGFISKFSAEPFESSNMNLPKDKFIIIEGNNKAFWLEKISYHTMHYQNNGHFIKR